MSIVGTVRIIDPVAFGTYRKKKEILQSGNRKIQMLLDFLGNRIRKCASIWQLLESVQWGYDLFPLRALGCQ